LRLTAEEADWLATLHGDGGTPYASIDTAGVMRTELVHAGAGEPLLPARRHSGVLATDSGSQLFTFDFVTSRYTSFAHHTLRRSAAPASRVRQQASTPKRSTL
jgi:hypothetical protein